MPHDREAELKRVEAKSKGERGRRRSDPNLTGGERGETVSERRERKRSTRRPKQAPIIEKTP